jgi:aspartyl-tRNA(Asn)/glutamyl-tRNA(Gln) amidotransferase subunit C
MNEMDKILKYVSKLNEVDTDGVEPLVNVLPICNVLREDEVVINEDAVEKTIANGPAIKDNMFVVPKTV